MLTKEDAKRIVEEHLAKRDCVILEEAIREFPKLWMFRYTARDGESITGVGPVTVHRETGDLRWFQSGPAEFSRLAAYERETRLGRSDRAVLDELRFKHAGGTLNFQEFSKLASYERDATLGRNLPETIEIGLHRYDKGKRIPLSPEPFLAMVARHPHEGPDPWGYYRVTLGDDQPVEIACEATDNLGGCAGGVRLWKPSTALNEFLFELALTNDLVLMILGRASILLHSQARRPNVVYFSAEQGRNLPDDLAAYDFVLALCSSPQQLWSLVFADLK